MFDNIGLTLRNAFQSAVEDLFTFIPKLFGALILLLVGWFVGKLIGKLVTTGLRAIQFNKVAEKAEIDDFLRNAGVKMDPSAVVGAIVRWFIYLTFFLAAFDALGLSQISAVIDDVLAFMPKVIVALIILLGGALAGNLLAGVVRGSLKSMGLQNADVFGTVARFAVIAFAAIAALDMLEIAPTVVSGLWTAMLALVVGTLILAFGLGGRQAASDLTLGRLLRAELEPDSEIQAGEYKGKVRAIGSLFTTLETAGGIVKVPNTQLTSQPVQMSPEQYQKQVQKRDEMKEKAKTALAKEKEEGKRAAPPNSTPTGTGSRQTVVSAAGSGPPPANGSTTR